MPGILKHIDTMEREGWVVGYTDGLANTHQTVGCENDT